MNRKKRVTLIGNKFNRLTVKSQAKSKKGKRRWICICDCGNNTELSTYSLLSGQIKSCGCYRSDSNKSRSTHGGWMDKKLEYQSFYNMKARCYNPKNQCYKDYGKRGITICKEWINSFLQFYNDMGKKPTNKHSIERIDNNKGYSKDNCKWATQIEQQNNKRNNVKIEVKKLYRLVKNMETLKNIAIYFNSNPTTIKKHINKSKKIKDEYNKRNIKENIKY